MRQNTDTDSDNKNRFISHAQRPILCRAMRQNTDKEVMRATQKF